MRAVAAAKFPINKPIEDSAQVARVIQGVQILEEEIGISNLAAVADLFRHNISLAESIQAPYYHNIWRKTDLGTRDMQQLLNGAYVQLQQLVITHHLPISCDQEKTYFTSEEVLDLARNIIQHASRTIIKAVKNPAITTIAPEELAEVIEKMLANYMNPSSLMGSAE